MMIPLLAVIVALAYWFGFRRRLRLVGRGPWSNGYRRALLFGLGLALVVAADSPPAAALADRFFWARTSQVMLIAMGAGPFLVWGAPSPALRRLWPRLRLPVFRRSKWVTAGGGFLLLNGGLWVWHLPVVYAATSSSPLARNATDAVFAVFGYLFWSQVIDQPPMHTVLNHLQRSFYLVAASMQMRALALVLGFARVPFYAHYSQIRGAGGALFDQQIGAGIILVPGVLSDLIALTVCLFLWLEDEDRKAPPDERGVTPPGQRALPPAVGWSGDR